MPEKKGSAWDQIPSLDLTLDEDYGDRIKSKECRRHPRTDFPAPIRVASVAHAVFDAKLLDISASGCRIVGANQLKAGELLKVRFVVEQRSITTKAIARWSAPDDDGFIAGLEFQDMPSDLMEFLGAFSSAAILNKLGKAT